MLAENQSGSAPSLATLYAQQVRAGSIKEDPAQKQVLDALQSLLNQLTRTDKKNKGFQRLIRRQAPKAYLRGLYIWGNVGRGKSMLMDMFFQHVPVKKKKRIHFHAFMQDVHARIHALRKQKTDDPVATLAAEIARDTTLLCFDELQATDVADASILQRLFSGLFEAGVVVVSTSNHPPATLYTGGVQRERFQKFIALIQEHMEVMALSSPSDYRHMQMKSLERVYFHPLGDEADEFVTAVLNRLCPGATPQPGTLAVQGRHTHFTLYEDSTGKFTFKELCESPLGPADYLAIARRLETVILTDIPKLMPEKRNEAKRFVTLVDALYEHKVQLICTAEVAPEQIYSGGDGAFEFKRTVSRLTEMQSATYLQEAAHD